MRNPVYISLISRFVFKLSTHIKIQLQPPVADHYGNKVISKSLILSLFFIFHIALLQ